MNINVLQESDYRGKKNEPREYGNLSILDQKPWFLRIKVKMYHWQRKANISMGAMSLNVLAYNMTRLINIMGVCRLG